MKSGQEQFPSAARLKSILPLWPLLPAAFYLITFLFVVLSYLLYLSFSTASGAFPTLATAGNVFAMNEFRQAFVSTLLFVIVGTPLELVAGLALAMLIYKPFFLRSIVRTLFIIPLAVPGLVTATLLFIIFDSNGGFMNHILMGKYWFFPHVIRHAVDWRGAQWSALSVAMIGKIWRDVPISMLILLGGINAIDPELFDAAKTMGAGLRQRFRYVILPLIIPAISSVLLLRSIEMWKEFIFPYILAGRYHLLGTLIEFLYMEWGGKYEHEAAFVALVLVGCIVVSVAVFMFLVDIVRRMVSDVR